MGIYFSLHWVSFWRDFFFTERSFSSSKHPGRGIPEVGIYYWFLHGPTCQRFFTATCKGGGVRMRGRERGGWILDIKSLRWHSRSELWSPLWHEAMLVFIAALWDCSRAIWDYISAFTEDPFPTSPKVIRKPDTSPDCYWSDCCW